jgi:hypothetical protein
VDLHHLLLAGLPAHLLKNSLWALEASELQKSTSQIDLGSTITMWSRVK